MMHSTKFDSSTFRALFLLSIFLVGACTSDPTDLSVEVCGNFEVPDEVDALRITLLDAERNQLRASVLPLLECPADRIRPLPQRTTFRDVNPNTELVLIAALHDQVVIARTERRIEELGEVRINLSTSCRGSQCTLGQACVGGTCVWTPTGSDVNCSGSPLDESDAGISDVGVPSDAGEGEQTAPPPRYCPADET